MLKNEAIADHRLRQLLTSAAIFYCLLFTAAARCQRNRLCHTLNTVCHEVHTLWRNSFHSVHPRHCASAPFLPLLHCCICLTANFAFHIFMRWHACANAVAKSCACTAKKKASPLILSVDKSNSDTCAPFQDFYLFRLISIHSGILVCPVTSAKLAVCSSANSLVLAIDQNARAPTCFS